MAACASNLRIRLSFGNDPLLNGNEKTVYWFLVNTDTLETIDDLCGEIKKKFISLKRERLKLILDDGVLPEWEKVLVLRDNDVVKVECYGMNDNGCDIDESDTPKKRKKKHKSGSKHQICDSEQDSKIINNDPKKKKNKSGDTTAEETHVQTKLENISKDQKRKKEKKDKLDNTVEVYSVQSKIREAGIDRQLLTRERQTKHKTSDTLEDAIPVKKQKASSPQSDTSASSSDSDSSSDTAVCVNKTINSVPRGGGGDAQTINSGAKSTVQTCKENEISPQDGSLKKKRRRRRRKKTNSVPCEVDASFVHGMGSNICPQSLPPSKLKPPQPPRNWTNQISNSSAKHIVFNSDDESEVVPPSSHSSDSGYSVHKHEPLACNDLSGNTGSKNQNTQNAMPLNVQTNGPVVLNTNENAVQDDSSHINTSNRQSGSTWKQADRSSNKETFTQNNGPQVFYRSDRKAKYNRNFGHLELSKEEQLNTVLSNKSIVVQNPGVSEPTLNQSVVPKNYGEFPVLYGPPRIGDNIAYKILELSDTYTPEVSEYKEGKVLSYDPTNQTMVMEMIYEVTRHESGRFEITVEDENEILTTKPKDKKVTVPWPALIETRLVNFGEGEAVPVGCKVLNNTL